MTKIMSIMLMYLRRPSPNWCLHCFARNIWAEVAPYKNFVSSVKSKALNFGGDAHPVTQSGTWKSDATEIETDDVGR